MGVLPLDPYYHKIFESWGRGVQMIIEKCKEAGHPTPFYELDKIGTALILPSKQLIGANFNHHNQAINLRQQEIITILKQHGELGANQHSPLKFRGV
ncbi:MAG: ATP-dependent helicase RecG [Pseudomonadota bacterium]|nr:ATP-dependent helicase RecG [Pseudomonadota bacterium]